MTFLDKNQWTENVKFVRNSDNNELDQLEKL